MATVEKVTPGQIFRHFRQLPEMRKLVEDCYLDEDVFGAAGRFYRSEEFSSVIGYVSSKGISPPSLVLDLGGGNGIASLAYYWAGYNVVLVEPDEDDIVGIGAAASFIRQSEYKVELCKAVGERLPFPNCTFDIVYARSVLHHVRDLDAVCAEVYRVLRPCGLFVATREHVISKQSDLQVFLDNHPVHRYTGGEKALLLAQYCTALKRAGFYRINVLGPWQSVINYYPMSRSQYADLCSSALIKFFGPNLGLYLASKPFILRLCGWYLTKREQTPGRLYSFIGVR